MFDWIRTTNFRRWSDLSEKIIVLERKINFLFESRKVERKQVSCVNEREMLRAMKEVWRKTKKENYLITAFEYHANSGILNINIAKVVEKEKKKKKQEA